MAIRIASDNVSNNLGGPFGAVIVQNNKIIARGTNLVTSSNDPTAHAEVNVIREAGKILSTHDLSECILYASSEPCPMCLAAILWARIPKVYYSNSKQVAANYGFNDDVFYSAINNMATERLIELDEITIENAELPFLLWQNTPNKIPY